ncbi:MAG TPA: patatin-like phospholipase family protein [Bacteroidales bacterium]|nr:patatin-like phospholipase family protein [Bacteroidales bacterium]
MADHEIKYNAGLVLSGGGARGFAHLGVIEALNESGIYPEVISGTSAGSLAGALYADGYTPREIFGIMNTRSSLDYFRPTMTRGGLMKISGVIKILRNNLRAKSFEELKIPLFVTATDINNGKAVYFSSGPLIDALVASSSIPVLFRPTVIDNIQYVDGGVLDNLPIKPIENICRFKIGSFVNPAGTEERSASVMHIAMRTFILSMSKEADEKLNRFNILVAPGELCRYGILDPEKGQEMFDLGYNAAMKKLRETDISSVVRR